MELTELNLGSSSSPGQSERVATRPSRGVVLRCAIRSNRGSVIEASNQDGCVAGGKALPALQVERGVPVRDEGGPRRVAADALPRAHDQLRQLHGQIRNRRCTLQGSHQFIIIRNYS